MFETFQVDILSTADPAMVRIKRPENLWDFTSSRLAEMEVGCRFLSVMKRQMFIWPYLLMSKRNGVMTCCSVTFGNKFSWNLTKTRQMWWSMIKSDIYDKTKMVFNCPLFAGAFL